MPQPKLSKLELRILEALWVNGNASIREIQETFPDPRPAYTTVQTIIYRMEAKGTLRRVRKIGKADIFEPLLAREATRNRVLDEVLSFFGGQAAPMMAQLADAGKLTPKDIGELEKTIKKLKAQRRQEGKGEPK
jgi:BlaI family penicillinase repressor